MLRKCQKCKSGISPLQLLGGHSPGTTCPLTRLLPLLNTLPVWHISHSTTSAGMAGARRSAGAGGSAGIHQSRTRLVELGRATGVFGSWSTAITERVPRTGSERGSGGGPGEVGTGWGSRGDPSSLAGQPGAPLPAPLLGRVVQLVIGDESL